MKAPLVEQVAETFEDVLSTTISQEKKQELRECYQRGEFGRVFPAGSGSAPHILVGRATQAQQLIGLMADVCYEKYAQGLHGVVIHGPRGTGKTALLNTFRNVLMQHQAKVIRMDGNAALKSIGRLMGRLSQYIESPEERTQGHTKGMKTGGAVFVKAEADYQHQNITKTTEVTPDQDVLSCLESILRNNPDTPVMLMIDEAHGADPAVLGELMNSVQTLGEYEPNEPIGFVLAGTPDLIDLLREESCKSTWFRDRIYFKRSIPMANDLSLEACKEAITNTLEAADVTIEGKDLIEMVSKCKGSPYFLQLLGECALESASQQNDVVRFTKGGEIDRAFESRIEERYMVAWRDVEDKDLSGCTRQLGELWRRIEELDEEITPSLISKAIQSGLTHVPYSHKRRLNPEEAEAYFKHLGLLWSTSADGESDWSLGLPSFFDYVESKFRNSKNDDHYEVLPKLEADMDALMKRIGRAKLEAEI